MRMGSLSEALRLLRAWAALDDEGRWRRLGRVRVETVYETP